MPTPPRQALLADERYAKVAGKAMRKHGLPGYCELQLRDLVSGETDPRTLQCCNTGCTPCAKDYLRASAQVIQELSRPRRRFLFF